MSVISNVINRLLRVPLVDTFAATVVLGIILYAWFKIIARVSSIDLDVNDTIIITSYVLIFFFSLFVVPLLLVERNLTNKAHYAHAIYAPLEWEFSIRKRKWIFDYAELRKIIAASEDNYIKHNMSVIYRNVVISLAAYLFHNVSTNFYYKDKTVQISIVTSVIIFVMLFDIARRMNRIVRVLMCRDASRDVVAASKEDVWPKDKLPLDEYAFEMLLDEETNNVLNKIKARSQEDIVRGLVTTGVLTPDGHRLTRKYGGSA